MPQARKRANPPPRRFADPKEEARVVMVLGLLSALGPFVVLGLGPLVRPASRAAPLAAWELVLLLGATPLVALMSLVLFVRARSARRYPEARGGAAVAAATLALALASGLIVALR